MSMRVRECVVSVGTAHKEMRQPAGWVDFDFEVMPFPVGIKIWRPVSNGVLMTKFESNTLENIIHLSGVLREKSLATRHRSNIIKDRLTIRGERSVSFFFYSNEEILISFAAGLKKMLKRFFCTSDFIAVHRAGQIKDN